MCACEYICLLSILQDFLKWGKQNPHQLLFTPGKRPLYPNTSLTIYLNCTLF
jgi:hypothetical protein